MSENHGRVNTYQFASPDSPLAKHLQQLFTVEAQRYEQVVAQLTEGVHNLLAVILFGSEARGEARPGSDTDLLIVVQDTDEKTEECVRENCLRLTRKYGLALSWHIADPSGLQHWEATKHPLWMEICEDGIRLNGESLERLRDKWRRGRSA